MVFRFEKSFERLFYAEVEADSFEEAKEIVDSQDVDWEEENDSYLQSSRCCIINDEGDVDEELEWSPF